MSDALADGEAVDLKTWGHLKWTMQILGQSFRMPLDDIALKTLCKSIYFRWLLDETGNDPVALKEIRGTVLHDKLLIRIVQHLSLAFEQRSFTNGESTNDSHIKQISSLNINLLFDIVKGLFSIIRKFQFGISEKSWSELLKVIFGIVDTVLSSHGSPDNSQYEYMMQSADRLAESLTQLLFETILRAKYKDSFMWELIIVRYCVIQSFRNALILGVIILQL